MIDDGYYWPYHAPLWPAISQWLRYRATNDDNGKFGTCMKNSLLTATAGALVCTQLMAETPSLDDLYSVNQQQQPEIRGEVLTRRYDTLWEIAAKVKPPTVNVQQAMMAILQRNPDAFENRNINRLRKGQVLSLPLDSEYYALTADQAIAAVALQNAAWRENLVTTADGGAKSEQGYLELSGSAAGSEAAAGNNDTVNSAGAGSQSTAIATLQSKVIATEERLDIAERANQETNSRIDALEQQIDTLIRLVDLKDQQLLDLQTRAAKGVTATTEAGSAAGQVTSGNEPGVVNAAQEAATDQSVDDKPASPANPAEAAAGTRDYNFPVEE